MPTHVQGLAAVTGGQPPTFKYAHLMRHPGDPTLSQAVPFRAYTMEIRKFISMNMSAHTKDRVARTMFVFGPPGAGKTLGAIATATNEGFSVMETSAKMYAAETESGAPAVLDAILSEMEAFSAAKKRRTLLLVNDLHLSIVAADDKTAKTINTGLLTDAFMNLADNRHLYRNFDGTNVAFIVTLNDGSKLPETIKRDGRAIRYTHAPNFEDKKNIAYAVLQPKTTAERALVEKVSQACRTQPVAFWETLKLEIQSASAERYLRNGIPNIASLDVVYAKRVPLEPDIVWACVKNLRTNRAIDWLKKRKTWLGL